MRRQPTLRFQRDRYRLVDLDQRPELISAAVNAFAAHGPGKSHLVTGLPWRMGQPPNAQDLVACTGVLAACNAAELLGVIAICPYSDEQVTLWGPAVLGKVVANPVAAELVAEAKRHLRKAGFASMRLLVDSRNRDLRAFALAHGFTPWKDNHVYDRALRKGHEPTEVRLAESRERTRAAAVLDSAFPDNDQVRELLDGKELAKLRLYVLINEASITGVAVVDGPGTRGWLKLLAVPGENRGKGLGRKLLTGVCQLEALRGTTRIALEVLADNDAANTLYRRFGFTREFTTTICVAPI